MQYFLTTITDFDERLTLFPYERFDLNEELILFRDPENAYQIKACLVKNENIPYADYEKIENEFQTFTSIFSLLSETPVKQEFHEMTVKVQDRTNIGYSLVTPKPSIKIALPNEIFHDLKIMATLLKTRKLWTYYAGLPPSSLKDRVTTALHYYLYAKRAASAEFRIINYCIAFEVLYVMDERSKKDTVSKRASKLLFPITWHNPEIIKPYLIELFEARNAIMHEGNYEEKIHQIRLHYVDKYLKTSLEIFLLLAEKYETKSELIALIDNIEGMEIDHILTKEDHLNFLRDESDIFELIKIRDEEQRKLFGKDNMKDVN